MKIIGINGSLRRESYNLKLLRAAGDSFSKDVDFDIVNLHDVPLYNEDLDGDNKPAAVVELLAQYSRADAVLYATPEYNYAIPGVLKNAIDWASRPAFKAPMTHQPAGIISASMSPIGGARAQSNLRSILAGTLSPVMTANELLVPAVHEVFDASGAIRDDTVARRLRRYIEAFEEWIAAA